MTRVKASNTLKKMSILYVEDEEFARESFSNILQRSIKTVHIATNGEEGLEMYLKNHIDIVISDINMPKMNGLEMAKKIKEMDSESIIVFTTAFGDNEYLQKSIDIGIDGYLIKPIDVSKVFTKLNSLAKTIYDKNEAERYSQLIKIILDEQREAILLLDENLDIKVYNNAFMKIYKNSGKEKLETIQDVLKYCKSVDNSTIIDANWFENITDKKELLLTWREDQDKTRYFQTVAKKVKEYIVFSLTDITKLKQESAKLKTEVITDKLTGLFNRKVLEVAKEDIFNSEIYAILLDIDNFKKINDTHGHLAGDKVLQELANVLQKTLRKNDLAIRWGGEEFLILLKDIPNLKIAKTIAEHLRKSINQLEIEKVGNFTCSFGVASMVVKTKKDLDTLFQKTDELLYMAKQNGKNRVEC